MYNYLYARPSVTCDVIVVTKSRNPKILLIKRANEPYKDDWALPGGFIEMNETLEASALRELKEETGLDLHETSQLKTYGNPGRDPRGRTITVVFLCTLEREKKVIANDDAKEARWFDLKKLPPLAFDHEIIITDYSNSLSDSSSSC